VTLKRYATICASIFGVLATSFLVFKSWQHRDKFHAERDACEAKTCPSGQPAMFVRQSARGWDDAARDFCVCGEVLYECL
jgi:hypothetical protein